MKKIDGVFLAALRKAIEDKFGNGEPYHHDLDEDWMPRTYRGIRTDVAVALNMKQGKLFHRRFQRAVKNYWISLTA